MRKVYFSLIKTRDLIRKLFNGALVPTGSPGSKFERLHPLRNLRIIMIHMGEITIVPVTYENKAILIKSTKLTLVDYFYHLCGS